MAIRTMHYKKEKCKKFGSHSVVPHGSFSQATQISNSCFSERAMLVVLATVSLTRRESS